LSRALDAVTQTGSPFDKRLLFLLGQIDAGAISVEAMSTIVLTALYTMFTVAESNIKRECHEQ